MKKARLDIIINVPDDFQCGDCKNCPLRSEGYTYYDLYETRTEISCKLGFNKIICPITIKRAETVGAKHDKRRSKRDIP